MLWCYKGKQLHVGYREYTTLIICFILLKHGSSVNEMVVVRILDYTFFVKVMFYVIKICINFRNMLN